MCLLVQGTRYSCWCIAVYFKFLAWKALPCTPYHAEHFGGGGVHELSGAIDNCTRLCESVLALQTHGLRQYITVPCHLRAILTERGHKVG